MAERYDADVAILGAGPAGTAAAAHLGELGVRRVVLVDRHDFPRDKTCGSGVSPRGIGVLKDLGVWDDVEPHSYPIRGIRIVTPGDRESWQSAGDVAEAVVCSRRILDHTLLKKALERGTTFVPHFDAAEAIEDGDRMVGFRARDGREVRARYTLVAGGSHCRVGLPELRPRRTIQAIMGWWDGVDFRPHHVEMLFDRMLEPYYGWLFPESETRVNIGITYEDPPGGKKNARKLFSRFLDKHYGDRLKNATRVGGLKGHPVVWSYRIDQLTAPGRIAIGESGLMTHPATAEGIYQGMRSGMLGAEAVADVLSGRRAEDEAFAIYERECRKAFQLSFWGGGLFRRLVRTDAMDWMIAVGDQPIVQSATAKIMARL
ncbi:MAG TPA: NAD(P)/FAD-dependent oxidoreductase [Sandaracinaceae bacterium LLY-WYZ-13_1]|nr:NAD(P)/FAD-dependent oxidoreductase [Sandaracinaceae bacterium LLY-WYZ-13_1]